MRVYISGPITGSPGAEKVFQGYENYLATLGFEPVNPFNVAPECLQEGAPGRLCHGDNPWRCHVRADLVAMLQCDMIYMLPGWEGSTGARLELQVAAAVGLKVMFPNAAITGGPAPEGSQGVTVTR
jgi:hypothetical protein